MPESSIIPADQILSEKIVLSTLQGSPLFPGVFAPMVIHAQEDVKAVEKAVSSNGLIGFVLLRNNVVGKASPEDLYQVGTVARIMKKLSLPDGGYNIFISSLKRFRIREVIQENDLMYAHVTYLDDVEDDPFVIKALVRTLMTEMKVISEDNFVFSEEMRLDMVNIDEPGKIPDYIASNLQLEKTEQQRLLEMVNVRQRMETVLVFIKKEQELLAIQKHVQQDISFRYEKNQRDFFLKEEMKSIKEELGMEDDSKGSDYRKFRDLVDSLDFTGEVKEAVESELEKFSTLEPQNPEYETVRSHLDVITSLPWKDPEPENYDIEKAKEILEADHYGLEDVKKRIMEYLAVRLLKKDSKGSILLLVGPPGVGKTSVGRSVANAMNKKFFRFSVGGMKDEAEIRGHRRTYVGAMPGKIIQGLKIVKSKSPVFMIDEVDKMGQSLQGDPSSALLEVLDPEQNVSFRDHYLDLPFDVSNIFFILTANSLDSIPEPLLDRAEIISLSGYIDQEKMEIGKRYLLPKSLEKNGLKKNQVKYSKEAFHKIAESYAREAGVRNFEKNLDKIHRKYAVELLFSEEVKAATQKLQDLLVARDAADGADAKDTPQIKAARKELSKALTKPLRIETGDIEKYLGKPVFDEEEILKADRPGTAIGLAWTSMGGDTLMIEALDMPCSQGSAGLQMTGQLGDVMRESATIAMSWVKRYALKNKYCKLDWFSKNMIHLHVPEGATPKDGPSAGITMATALLSLIRGKKIKPHLAMTGELSLTGRVLPIGGLKEKTVAAKRNKIKTIIIPKQNERDLSEIPDIVKEGLTFCPVSTMEEVLEIVFGK